MLPSWTFNLGLCDVHTRLVMMLQIWPRIWVVEATRTRSSMPGASAGNLVRIFIVVSWFVVDSGEGALDPTICSAGGLPNRIPDSR